MVSGEAEEQEVEPKELEETVKPDYLKDDPPAGKTKYIKWGLMHGITEEKLEEEGYNVRSIAICAQELEKDGYRQRPKREKVGRSVATTGKTGVQVFAKGSPPEALIEAISVPLGDGQAPAFEKGIKFGANLIVLGVRVAQELSNLGVQQARPIIDMARSMREGEALAAKSAAMEAATEAAGMVAQQFGPAIANLTKSSEADPMKGMMARTMEPIIQRLMNQFLPGGDAPLPSDWTKSSK